jgi:serine/threonine-protein kinase
MPEAHEALASYWSLGGDNQKAHGELLQALAGRPNDPHLHRLLGASLRNLGRWEESLEAFERGTRLDPYNRMGHYQAALTYSRVRRYDEAITHWNHVIAMDPNGDPFPQVIRGFNYLRLGNVDSLNAAIDRVPLGRDAGGMVTYARYTVHRIKGRHAEALASLDSAKSPIISDHGPFGLRTTDNRLDNRLLYRPIVLLRAQTQERMGDVTKARSAYDAARMLLEDSVAGHPSDPSIHVALGLAYAGLHRRADAMREARTATALVPVSDNSPSATAFMGGAVEIYAQLGEKTAALELIELLLAMPAGREMSVPLLRLDPTFDPLRSDPRFVALLARFSRN